MYFSASHIAFCVRAIIALILLAAVASCARDPNEEANKIFVEANQLIVTSEKQDATQAIETLISAENKLQQIITQYPTSNLAVQLTSGQAVGDVSFGRLRAVITSKRADNLFSEVRALVALAKEQGPDYKLQKLLAAEDKLKSIAGEAPGADLALQLASGQTVAGISFFSLRSAVVDAQRSACFAAPTRACVLEQATRAVASIPDAPIVRRGTSRIFGRGRVHYMVELAYAKARAGFVDQASALVDEAVQQLREVKEPRFLGIFLPSMAPQLLGLGKIAEVKQLIEASFVDEKRPPHLSRMIAEFQSKNGQIPDAIVTLKEAIAVMRAGESYTYLINDHLFCLITMAKFQVAAGEIANAEATVRESLLLVPLLAADQFKVFNLSLIAEVQAEAQSKSAANETLSKAMGVALSLSQPELRAGSLAQIAQSKLIIGYPLEARKILTTVLATLNERRYQKELGNILLRNARLLEIADVLAITESMEDDMQSGIRGMGVAAKIDIGDLEEALQIAESIKGATESIRSFAAIGRAQAKAQQIEKAASNFERAVGKANTISDNIARERALAILIEEEARGGRIKEAMRVVELFRAPEWRAKALLSVSEFLPQ